MSFPRYPKYKDSGVQWLGEVPEHWEVCKLKHIARSIEQGWSPQCEGVPAEEEVEWGVLKVGCVNRGTFNPSENKLLPADLEPIEDLSLRAGDLLVSRANTRQLVGSAAVVPRDHPRLMLCDKLYRIRFLVGTCAPRLVSYHLGSTGARDRIELEATGASDSMVNIGQSAIMELAIALGSLEEQRRIEAFIDEEVGKLDELVSEQRRLMDLLKEKRHAVISHAVTKGLNPHASMKPSGIEWLGDVPAHWEVVPLKHLIADGNSVSYGIVQPGEPLDEGVPFVQTTNMTNGTFALDGLQRTSPSIAAQFPRTLLVGGEVILGIRASIGAAHVVPDFLAGANLSRGVARIQPSERIAATYLVAYLGTRAVAQYWQVSKQGSTFNEVSIETVRELAIAVPPPAEQERITETLGVDVEKLDSLVAEAQRAIDLLQERRTALISAAVTGQIDVRNFAPRASA